MARRGRGTVHGRQGEDGVSPDGERGGAFSRPPTAQEAVLREIRQAIMARRLKPGQWIRQWEIARQLDVSSVPVREALNTLQAEGQVIHERHRGYKVVELSVEQLEEIYLARGLLESEVTRRAVPRLDEELIQRLAGSIHEMDRLAADDEVLEYAEANRDFHFLLFGRAGLPRICRLIEVLWQNTEAYRGLIADRAWYERAHAGHLAILEACGAGDVEAAVAAQNEHRQNALDAIIAYLRGPPG